jgi:queuosine precursor transporter
MSVSTVVKPEVQRLDILLAVYIAAIMAAELLGSKIFTAFGLNASVAIFVFPLTFTINDVVAEVYGKARAQSFVKAGFVTMVFLFLFTLLAIVLPPAGRFMETNPAYQQVFAKSLRMIVASLTAFWIAERLDVYIFAKVRAKLGQRGLWFRNNVSNFLSQGFDTFIFMFLAFYRPGNFWFIISLILPYWGLKCLCSVVQTPLTYLGVGWLQGKQPKLS